MSDENKCDQCGAPLAAGTPEGLCPACLLKRALDTQTAGGGLGADFTPPAPEDLARYFPQLEILELLGRGGMGVVYKARQRDLDRMVALKILPSAAERDPAFAERFAREARALARLSHPNIVAVYDSGQRAGLFYFVMEYVDGLNLRQLLASAKMTPREALAIVPQICEALQTAHDQGIVHRDIKPENILMDKKGRVKIADFGIAKIVGGEEKDLTLTGAGEMMGTPAYMAPEQIEHPGEVDHRADIYSLGVVFYQMLTGELPLGKFAPPSRKVEIDVRLDEVVLRALEKEPGLRYQQASEVRTQVQTIAASPGDGAPKAASAAAPEPPVSPERLGQMQWNLMGLGILMAFSGFMESRYIYALVEPALGIFVGAWAILFGIAVLQMAGTAGRNFAKVKAAAQVTVMGGIAVLGLACWLALEDNALPTPWRICLMVAFTAWIISGLLKLTSVGPFARNLWTLDQRERQPIAWVAWYLAFMSGLIPTLFYWLKPWVAPSLSDVDQEFALLLTLWAGLNATALGLGARKSRIGRIALVIGVINVSIWLLMCIAGILSDSRAAGNLPEWLQQTTDDILPGGTVRFTETSSIKNNRPATVTQDEFVDSSFVHIEKLTDAMGQPLLYQTTTENSGDVVRYRYAFNVPVPPGGMMTNITEGAMENLIHPTGNPNEFEYHLDHSPGYNGVTRRIETHRLPPGAVLVSKSPDDLKVMSVGDHIELFIDRKIPRGGDIDIRYRYRLPAAPDRITNMPPASPAPATSQAVPTPANLSPIEQPLGEYQWPLTSPTYTVSEQAIKADGRVELEITNTADAPLQWHLTTIDRPAITSMIYEITGDIRYEGVDGSGYLEMWSCFPPAGPGYPEGRYFSSTLGKVGSGPMEPIAGTSDWRTFELPFDRTGSANPPDRLELNIFLPGRGTVYIGPLKLIQLAPPKGVQVIINVKSDGSIIVDNQPISAGALAVHLAELGKSSPGQPVILRGDKGVSYESIAKILDLCKKAGLQNVAFANTN